MTGLDPSEVTVPPHNAENVDTSVIGAVSTIGVIPGFLHEISKTKKKKKLILVNLTILFI